MQEFEKYTQFKHIRTITHRDKYVGMLWQLVLSPHSSNTIKKIKISMTQVKKKDKRDAAA